MGASEAMGPDAVLNDIMLPASARVDVEAVRGHEKAAGAVGPDVNGGDDPRDNAADAAADAKENRKNGGPPDERGRPEDVGPPEDRGSPEDRGAPEDRGPPEERGRPDSPPGRG